MEDEKDTMLGDYDFSCAQRNPYVKRLKRQITINIDSSTIDYFKNMAEVKDIPYQTLMNLYLRDCAENQRQLNITWA